MMKQKPKIAISIGDPAGIGPEIVLKALRGEALREIAEVTVVGSRSVLQEQAQRLADGADLISEIERSSAVRILDVPLPTGRLEFGQVSAACGAASFEYLKRCIELAKAQQIDGIVTAPVHKESWKAAKVPFIGHTEALCGLLESSGETLFVVDKLRIFFLTRHVSLAEAIRQISEERLLQLLRHAQQALKWLGLKEPRIAVAALNPHASDGGLFGDEERTKLLPAVLAARQEGIHAFGPLPADSVFHQCAQGEFDAVISLYHDQGHIAAKMKDFLGTVSVTTGLPVLRTSVDHGTAFDIAGKDKADPTSMLAAIGLTAQLIKGRAAV